MSSHNENVALFDRPSPTYSTYPLAPQPSGGCPVCLTGNTDFSIDVRYIRGDSPWRGCAECRFLWNVAKRCVEKGILPYPCSPREGSPGARIACCHDRNRWCRIRWTIDEQPHPVSPVEFRIFCLPDTPKPFPGMMVKKPLAKVDPEECVTHVRRWMLECESHHQFCLPEAPSPLPKRVIDTGMLTAPTVRLVETTGETERYVCLSHCWGRKGPACITTTTTLERNKGEIAWDLLPATFQDAIEFTRRLQLRFLWIDSICIIQDSPQDWQEQSAMMADIYGGAYVTLCATASTSDEGGFYLPPIQYFSPHWLRIPGPDGVEYDVLVETGLEGGHIPSWQFVPEKEELRHSFSYFPLMSRAWTFQERLLSPRLVHFTRGEVMWECSGLKTFRCSGFYLPPAPGFIESPFMTFGVHAKSEYSKTMRTSSISGQNPLHSGHWASIVSSYTMLRLTFESDILLERYPLEGYTVGNQTRRGCVGSGEVAEPIMVMGCH
ncbi:heterokaryon incompatibility protein-domain-containing protein [Echria macrotheca]|uniref:Heterokaryon incompatibility protein-domain-containing protein n=1 Tax=Echria macrotheca TaxID=438768 RepID=A0AAJ0BLC5_9PEZI|nr:heterokaryon incompatibility protein-domain-containing protein [Echria macrotheca]